MPVSSFTHAVNLLDLNIHNTSLSLVLNLLFDRIGKVVESTAQSGFLLPRFLGS